MSSRGSQLPNWRRGVLLTLPLVGLLSGASGSGGQAPFRPPDCGTASLFVVLRLCGVDVSLQDVTRELPQREEAWHSMAELQATSARLGLALEGYSFSKKGVPLRRPVIALIKGRGGSPGHYLALAPAGTTGKMVQIIDHPFAPRILDYDAIFGPADELPVLSPVETLSLAQGITAFLATLVASTALLLLARRLRLRTVTQRRAANSLAEPRAS